MAVNGQGGITLEPGGWSGVQKSMDDDRRRNPQLGYGDLDARLPEAILHEVNQMNSPRKSDVQKSKEAGVKFHIPGQRRLLKFFNMVMDSLEDTFNDKALTAFAKQAPRDLAEAFR